MKKSICAIIILCLIVSGCADTIPIEIKVTPVGFWYGVWHGMILPFSWIGSLFDDSIAIYAVYNNGGWYDFGFFLGIGGLASSTTATNKRR